jgi:UDP-N-acetylmuramoyl-L-alanyl-D-glutamate--2,6-diaminopimelate ligase
MRFSDLLTALPDLLTAPSDEADVTAAVSEDNRTIQPGGVFIARRGSSVDGHDLIASAVANGAVAVVGERPPDQVRCGVPYAQVGEAMLATGRLAAAYHGYPSRRLTVIGVTGTDGKTTTSTLIFNILKVAGLKTGLISTVSAVIGDEDFSTGLHVTTPGADEIQGYLARMVRAGLTHCVLETTSHGLAQGRVNGVEYDVAVLTNLTHEHLDFHRTFEGYREAKGKLFASLGQTFRKPDVPKIAVVNGDDAYAAYFLAFPADAYLTYSTRDTTLSALPGSTTVKAIESSLRFGPTATAFTVHATNGLTAQQFALTTALVGRFNVENILAATAAALGLGLAPEIIQAGVATLKAVPGRMERIDEGQSFLALVDFAHTPNALRRALEAARTMLPADRRVITVFGCAGLRDREKRRLMAEVSAELADIAVFTAEDPRTESLEAILATMAHAAVSKGGIEGQTFHLVPDRGTALHMACTLARSGDLVIACGKGHEQSMCFGTVEYAWDDRDGLRAALRGTPLRTLPTAPPL